MSGSAVSLHTGNGHAHKAANPLRDSLPRMSSPITEWRMVCAPARAINSGHAPNFSFRANHGDQLDRDIGPALAGRVVAGDGVVHETEMCAIAPDLGDIGEILGGFGNGELVVKCRSGMVEPVRRSRHSVAPQSLDSAHICQSTNAPTTPPKGVSPVLIIRHE